MNQPARIKKTGEEVEIVRLSGIGMVKVRCVNRARNKSSIRGYSYPTLILRRSEVENIRK